MAYALSQEEGITLGNRNFLGESYEAGFTEVPVSELMNAGYEETMAYTTVDFQYGLHRIIRKTTLSQGIK